MGAGEVTPVALFVYRRHGELERTLSCLRDAGTERLYVFSDGPGDSRAAADVAAVRACLARIDWIEPTLIEQPANLGLSRSIRTGLDRVFAEHETAIVIEDDIWVAPGFHEYARSVLDHYRDESRVAGVTGLRYPFDRGEPDTYPFDVFMSPRFSSWAWATWRDRWQAFEFDLDVLRRRIAAAPDFDATQAGADMAAMIEAAVIDETLGGSWDVLCATNMLLDGRYFVTSMWNMLENRGFEEGTHAGGAPGWELAWEPGPPGWPEIPLRFAPAVPDERVLKSYRRFFVSSVTGGPLRRADVALSRWRSARRLRRGTA